MFYLHNEVVDKDGEMRDESGAISRDMIFLGDFLTNDNGKDMEVQFSSQNLAHVCESSIEFPWFPYPFLFISQA